MNKVIPVLLALVTMMMVLPGNASAGTDDQVICAAIHPCNLDGSVIAGYDSNTACGLRYARECLSEKSNAVISECANSQQALEESVRKLTTKNKKLARDLRRERLKR